MCKCAECGEEIDGDVYGEWDDICHGCYEETKDDE